MSESELDNTVRSWDSHGEPVDVIALERPARVAIAPDGRAYVAFAYRGIGRCDLDARGKLAAVA